MTSIDRAVRRAGIRLMVVDFLRHLTWCVTGVLAVLVAMVLLERLARVDIAWETSLIVAGSVTLVAAVVWTCLTKRSQEQVAIELDDRANLRESLSTALLVRNKSDGWSRAVVESAEAKAKGVRVREAVPIQAPGRWYAPAIGGGLLLLAWMAVPTLLAEGEKSADTMAEVKRVLLEQRDNQKKLDELLKKAKVDLGEEKSPFDTDLAERADTPEKIQQMMVKKLTSLTDTLQNKLLTQKQRMAALTKELAKLKSPGEGPLSELSRKLAAGDLSGAKDALAELQKKIESGDMSDELKAQLKKQLDDMAKQLDDLAKQAEQMEQKLSEAMKNAGMTEQQIKQALKSPEAMKRALEQMKNMSPGQKQQLQDMMEKLGACKQCSGLGQGMSAMGQKMGSGQMGDMLGEMGEMGEMLSALEMSQQDMQAMQAAFDEAKYQLDSLCQGMGQGMAPQFGIQKWQGKGGSGGLGSGNGASPADSPFAFNTHTEKAKSDNLGGPIIASMMVDGPQISGESKAQFANAVVLGEQAASEAIDNMLVPRELQGAVKSYFGSLSEQGK